MEGEVIR